MRYPTRAASPVLIAIALFCAPPAQAPADVSGGAQAPSAPLAGGSEYGVAMRTTFVPRPVVGQLSVPLTATAGRPPRVTLRVDEKGVGTVNVRVTVTDLSTRRPALVVAMGWIHTGRVIAVVWPRGGTLAPGSYHVSLAARDHHGATLLRRAHSSGVAGLTVKAKPPPAPAPAPVPTPIAPGPPTPTPIPGAAGAVFPVQGPHNFGGPENRFGAARAGHIHQGQDVLAAEGTPVVAPVAGTITTATYQAGGAGYYAVEHATDGFDFMFAHCQAGSLAVAEGQAVSAGEPLCKVGQTGDATGPHLHFEMWVGGWQAAGGHPIDPLPYLQAWEQG
ncbi:MAG TPA: M23 family metallopeptidase [Solirubrobacteraceae bacterium]|jgi:biotin carboxyl carrier protein